MHAAHWMRIDAWLCVCMIADPDPHPGPPSTPPSARLCAARPWLVHVPPLCAMEWLRTPLVDERAAADAAAAADAQAQQAQPKKDGRHRLLQLDLLRGCIMAVMAWGQQRNDTATRTTMGVPHHKGQTSCGPGGAQANTQPRHCPPLIRLTIGASVRSAAAVL